jgi:hypothetical protein
MMLRIMHPRARDLQRFAEGELSPARQSRIARHLAECSTCRATVTFSRSVRDSLGAVEGDAPRSVIERVIAERAAGTRTILPAVDAPEKRTHHGRKLWITSGIAAAAALLLLPTSRLVRRDVSRASIGTLETASYFGTFLRANTFAAFAAQPAPPSRELPAVKLSGARLRPAHFEYARLLVPKAGPSQTIARGTFDVSAERIEGRDAWKIVQMWHLADTTQAETLHVDRASLGLLGRVVRETPYLHYRGITIRQRVVGDSVVGWMNTDEGLGRPIARRLRREFSPYISDAMALLALSGTSIDRDWKGELSLLGWAVRPNDLFIPVTLAVSGEERLTVPAGTFDCWRIAIGIGRETKSVWIRKSDGLAVRTRDESSDSRGIKDIVLVHE